MAPIFDIRPHSLEGPAGHAISHFDYLNCSSRIEAQRVRHAMEEAFARYPVARQDELRHRLRSIHDGTHLSASFELFVHELFVRSGHVILEVEPTLAASRRRPDFLIQAPDSSRFYMEATLVTGQSSADAGANARLASLLAAIDDIVSPDYFLNLRVSGKPASPVRVTRVAHDIRQWLRTLDYQQVQAAYETGRNIPSFSFKTHGLALHIRPCPRNASRGTQSGRVIGAQSGGPIHVSARSAIKRAIKAKAGRYGQLDMPFVLAVNALSIHANEEVAFDALFGRSAVSFVECNGRFHERAGRVPEGAWRGVAGPQNTRVSAVLSTERFNFWNLATCDLRTFLNPWAQWPLNRHSWPGHTVSIQEPRIVREEGVPVHIALGLHSEWPESGELRASLSN